MVLDNEMSELMKKSCRDDILRYAAEHYGAAPEYLWARYPGYAVLRHADSKKWYALVMDVQREKLGLPGEGTVDILDIKCDPDIGGALLSERGIMPAYHMNRKNWITVLLDGSVEREMIISLLERSFELTASRKSGKKTGRHRNKAWLIPANPKYYDLEEGFAESETMLWKQTNNIAVGDIIYIYMAAPVSAIRYQCRAMEVDIPYHYDDGILRMNRVMKIRLLHRFEEGQLGMEMLKECGVFAVRSPRSVPNSLLYEIEALCKEEEGD